MFLLLYHSYYYAAHLKLKKLFIFRKGFSKIGKKRTLSEFISMNQSNQDEEESRVKFKQDEN